MKSYITRHIVTAVDHGESCDGKARVLVACKTRTEAEEVVRSDIEQWAAARADEGVEIDFDKMRTTYDYDTNSGCEWNIESVEIEL